MDIAQTSRTVAMFAAAVLVAGAPFQTARAALPVGGAAFHVDASDTSTMTLSNENGTNYVTRWNDASGGSRYATAGTDHPRPYLGTFNGRSFVDFGTKYYPDQAPDGYGANMLWSSRDSDIREIFMLFSDHPGESGSFLLSDTGTYHFHRSGKKIFHETYASDNLRNGLIEVDGVQVASDYELPEGFHIIHLRTTGGVHANSFAADRTYFRGGIRLGEVIIYDSPLSAADAALVYTYLESKWLDHSGLVEIDATPARYGTPTPAYGVVAGKHAGDTIEVSCPASVVNASGTTRAACIGWKLYNDGGTQVSSGAGTSYTYVHPTPAAGRRLEWQWRVEHRLAVTSGGHGTVAPVSEWQLEDATVTLQATPETGATFVRWTGDIDPAQASSATLTFTMGHPRRLIAVFDKPGAAARSLAYQGGDWFAPSTWDGVAIPGTNDTVTIASSASISIGAQVDVGDLILSGGSLAIAPLTSAIDPDSAPFVTVPAKLHVARNLTLDGASTLTVGTKNSSIRSDVVVGGTLTVADTSSITAYAAVGEANDALRTWSHYKAGGAAFNIDGDLVLSGSARVYSRCHSVSGVGVVWNVGGDAVIGESAQFNGSRYTSDSNCTGYGWEWPYGLGAADPSVWDWRRGGGSYGGAGGLRVSGSVYGYAWAPFYPGSPGSGQGKGNGGGAVRLAARGDIHLNGRIYVTGGDNDGYGNHAGSGGGVWLTCRTFAPGESARIHARGGRANQHSSCCAGGGGRVCIVAGSPTETQIDALYATGTAGNISAVTEDLNDQLTSPWPALVNVRGGENNDMASSPAYETHGKPGTAVYLLNTTGKAIVTVTGSQPTSEAEPGYGVTIVDPGQITFTAPDYIYIDNGLSRYPCAGYSWEDAAGNTGSGEGTSFTLDVRRDTTVTWLWGTVEHFLSVRDGGFCTISYEEQGMNVKGWYDEGTVVRVSCTPADSATTFDAWVGDVPDAAKGRPTIDIEVDKPKTIIATLHRDASRARSLVWTGNGNDTDWFNKANWDGVGIPGRFDSATVTGAVFQVKYPSAVEVASLAIGDGATGYWGADTSVHTYRAYDGQRAYVHYTTSVDPDDKRPYKLTVAGNLSLSNGARLYFGGVDTDGRMDLAVRGNLTMSGESSSAKAILQVYACRQGATEDVETFILGGGSVSVGGAFTLAGHSEFSPCANRFSGAPVPVKAGSFSLGENAVVNADCRGFGRKYYNPGNGMQITMYGPGSSGSNYAAGSYGGLGGYRSGGIYGFEAAPYMPGSAGSHNGAYWGDGEWEAILSAGGAVRIDADQLVINGGVYADGCGFYSISGGSGGGIWLTCRRLTLGRTAYIRAKGGDSTSYGNRGGGGGGRISICVGFQAVQLDRMYNQGFLNGMEVVPLAEVSDSSEIAQRIGCGLATRHSVSGGAATPDGQPGSAGTAVFVRAPSAGTMLIMQ